MLEARGIAVSYGLHEALHEISIEVDRGEIVVMLGANGAGKSSLLRALAGISEGLVTGGCMLGGQDLIGMKPDAIVEAGLALVPEGRGIFADLNVMENLTLGAYPARARAIERDNLEKVLELFPKLRDRRSQIVRTMSGGEQQMVAIGRALMSNPEILLLDEPSLGLSPLLCGELFRNLRKIRDAGLGVLLVEQNARQSLAIADRGYLLENGRITGADSAESLILDPAVQKAYLGGAI
ncbi:ABC transporter ATP-binding protein [Nisaea acidiphila]|uniref:ABC transporter ATP-binding protein n=1 Tax=Nisaea acidiphila TaxID=1862145 RepID=A0A9J7ARP0_9PROT|nr:ABC transporter ATP-binding protein [Nisaea acidiphila]UUX49919.1 ABC transporter ATP-binding protein [Nisaea acidiphila]